MNIVYILPTLFRGGAEKSTLFLASSMRAAGHEVSVLSIRESGPLLNDFRARGNPVSVRNNLKNALKDLVPEKGLEMYYRVQVGRYLRRYSQQLNLPPPNTNGSLERWVKDKLRSISPHIVHVHQSSCVEALQWARECGVRGVVYTHHNMTGDVADSGEIRRFNDLIGCANRVTFVSLAQREDFLRHIRYAREQTDVIYPETSFVGTVAHDRHTPPPLILGTMSNLSPVKDPMTLLSAIDALSDQGIDFRLQIAGGDPRFVPVIKRTVDNGRSRGRVRFLGALETDLQVQSFYDSIDVYVTTSLSESFGLTVKEAMASGVAVVSSDVAPVTELVAEGRTGLIFQRGNSSDLASKIRLCLDHPARIIEMKHRAREFVTKKFPSGRTPAEYRRIYEELLSSR